MKVRLDLRALAADRPVHFMGVGGAGMYPLAELLLRSGGRVSGCDTKDSGSLRALEALGAEVSVGHDEAHVADAASEALDLDLSYPDFVARAAGV